VRAVLFGVEPRRRPRPVTDNRNLLVLARSHIDLVTMDDPVLPRPDWILTRPRLTGICGSESKAVFADYAPYTSPERAGDAFVDNPMMGFFSFPHVMGHEVVADVVEVGPDATGVSVGDRVVLNPWLTCAPRGVRPLCDACTAGDLSQCHSFSVGPIAPGIHTGMCADVPGGFGELMPAHDSMVFRVPESVSDEQAVFADPFAVSLHAVTRHPPPPGGRVLVYGAGALGLCTMAILRDLHPDVAVLAVSRFPEQSRLAGTFGAATVDPEPRADLVEVVAEWSGGVLQPADGLPMAHPGGVDVVYDTIGAAETLEVGARVLRTRGTLVKLGVHGPARWEDTPVYFKELTFTGSNAFGVEQVGDRRQHAIAHFLELSQAGRVDLTPLLTHTFALDEWYIAFEALADQATSGAVKVAFDQR